MAILLINFSMSIFSFLLFKNLFAKYIKFYQVVSYLMPNIPDHSRKRIKRIIFILERLNQMIVEQSTSLIRGKLKRKFVIVHQKDTFHCCIHKPRRCMQFFSHSYFIYIIKIFIFIVQKLLIIFI